MRALLLAMGAALGVASHAMADTFAVAGLDKDDSVLVIMSSIRKAEQADTRTLWLLHVYAAPHVRGENSYDYTMAKNTADCTRDTMTSSYTAAYTFGRDAPVQTETGSRTEPVIPGTWGATIQALACGRSKIDPSTYLSGDLGSVSRAARVMALKAAKK